MALKMKLIKGILAAGLALAGLLAGQAVYAQSTNASLTVSATIPKACRFYSTPANMTIEHSGGLIDPLSTINATGSSTLNYRCMSGVSPEFDIDQSSSYASPKVANVTLTDGTNNLTAQITVTATGGAGTGLGGTEDKTATISGEITPANFQAAVPSTYSKSVRVDIQAIP